MTALTVSRDGGPAARFGCRLCWRVAIAMMSVVVAVEAVVLYPSYKEFEHDLLARLEHVGRSVVTTAFSLHGHSSPRDLITLGTMLTQITLVRGGHLFDASGKKRGTFGEAPTLSVPTAGAEGPRTARTEDGSRYDVYRPAGTEALPFTVIGRLDSAWLASELSAFVWKLAGLIALVSGVVTAAAMIVLNRMVLSRLLRLRRRLLATADAPQYAGRQAMPVDGNDELSDVTAAFNEMLARLEANLERIERDQRLLREARDEAVRANRAKSAYLSNMSHDLRTPINAILGFGQLIEYDPSESLSTKQHDRIELILQAGNYVLALVDGVLDLAKIEAGEVDVVMEDIGPAAAIAECVTLTRGLAENSRIRLLMGATDTALPAFRADRQLFAQVLLNLLSNGIKYNRAGGSVTLECKTTDAGALRFSVTDTGVGIPLENQNELFVPFKRLNVDSMRFREPGSASPSAANWSSGWGMGGRIGCESVHGEGSTFWVEFAPAEAPQAKTPAAPADRTTARIAV